MASTLILFDDQQIQQIEQIVMDQDEPGALRCIVSLRKMIKRGQIGCDPLEFKAKESVDHVIGKTKKHI
jgi:hypothetical protein